MPVAPQGSPIEAGRKEVALGCAEQADDHPPCLAPAARRLAWLLVGVALATAAATAWGRAAPPVAFAAAAPPPLLRGAVPEPLALFAAEGRRAASSSRTWIVMLKDVKNVNKYMSKMNGRGTVSRSGRQVPFLITEATQEEVDGVVADCNSKCGIDFVELDQPVSASATASWGLDRIDARKGLDGNYVPQGQGTGANIYIVDTGIRTTHQDFGGRAFSAYDAFTATACSGAEGCAADGHGHGTHCAATAGGGSYGVATNATLYAVKVLDDAGSGSTAGVISGIDWVVANAVRPAVISMSLGGGRSTALDTAVTKAFDSNINVVVAAGNDGANACNYSPARAPKAVTVGATTSTDAAASYSNLGSCVDIFAPGSGITSAWMTSDSASNTISGTSMATPHVAGAAAILLAQDPRRTSLDVTNLLLSSATPRAVALPKRPPTANALLYVGR